MRSPDFPFPEPPPGSPFEDFFREFFDQEPAAGADAAAAVVAWARASWSIREGYVVTNNHVIAEADEIQVVFNDETTYDATLVGRDTEDRPRAAQDRGATIR